MVSCGRTFYLGQPVTKIGPMLAVIVENRCLVFPYDILILYTIIRSIRCIGCGESLFPACKAPEMMQGISISLFMPFICH